MLYRARWLWTGVWVCQQVLVVTSKDPSLPQHTPLLLHWALVLQPCSRLEALVSTETNLTLPHALEWMTFTVIIDFIIGKNKETELGYCISFLTTATGYICIRAVKSINRIQNKSLCLHNIWVCVLCICIHKYIHIHVYIQEIFTCIYIYIYIHIYIWFKGDNKKKTLNNPNTDS